MARSGFRRRLLRRPVGRIQVIGRDATVVASLRSAGWDPVERGADASLVLDPTSEPRELPRGPLRVALVAPGDGPRWAQGVALEDADAVLVTTESDREAVDLGATNGVAVVDDVAAAATELERVLADLRARPRLHLLTGVSNLRMRSRWGDHHFALALARAAGRHGWLARSWCQAELAEGVDHTVADAALLLVGKVELVPVPGVPTSAWVISHPERLEEASFAGLVHVHVASTTEAAKLVARGVPASALLQATDPARFAPTPGGTAHDLLFVANSRNVRRRILDDLLPTDHELAVYGQGWTPELLDPRHLVADHVPNAELAALYSAAGVVLNDHWDQMRARGFLANRLFDAAACGAAVVSDRVLGLDEVFDGTIAVYDTPSELRRLVDGLLADDGRRRALGERARQLVLTEHTFDARFASVLAALRTAEVAR